MLHFISNNIVLPSRELVKDEIRYLKDNDIDCFYHFTAKENLNSIDDNDGLFSWYSCEQRGIEIARAGGDKDSRNYDMYFNLEDYARLSFCDDHPMAYGLHCDGVELYLLKISLEVLELADIKFSDVNAASRYHREFTGLDGLKNINLEATQMHYVSRRDDCFYEHQAEIMIKSHIPSKYIIDAKKMYF